MSEGIIFHAPWWAWMILAGLACIHGISLSEDANAIAKWGDAIFAIFSFALAAIGLFRAVTGS